MLIKYVFYAFMLTPVGMYISIILFPDSSKEIIEWGFVFGIAFFAGLWLPLAGGSNEKYNPNDHIYRNGAPIDIDRSRNKWK